MNAEISNPARRWCHPRRTSLSSLRGMLSWRVVLVPPTPLLEAYRWCFTCHSAIKQLLFSSTNGSLLYRRIRPMSGIDVSSTPSLAIFHVSAGFLPMSLVINLVLTRKVQLELESSIISAVFLPNDIWRNLGLTWKVQLSALEFSMSIKDFFLRKLGGIWD